MTGAIRRSRGCSSATSIIGLYSLDLLAMVVASVFVPLLKPVSKTDGDRTGADEERDAHAEADEADLAARLRELRTSQARFELYEDTAGEHRWRLRHRNGNIIADSGQGYADRTRARDGIERVKRHAPNADTEA